jgi:hypothetical protein
MSSENRVGQMLAVQKEGLELFKQKNADYGDSFANYGPVGVIVRMGDKIHRLSSVTKSGVHFVNESVRDTLIDLHNYAAMAIMLLDEKKSVEHPRINEIKSNYLNEQWSKDFKSKHKSTLHGRLKNKSFAERRKMVSSKLTSSGLLGTDVH